MVQDRPFGPGFCFICLHNRRRSCIGGGGGAILSGIGLSGSDRDERDSNLSDISREAVVSNNEVEKFGIPQRMHSHAILLLSDLL